MNFKNETGYAKRQTYKPTGKANQTTQQPPPPNVVMDEKPKLEQQQSTLSSQQQPQDDTQPPAGTPPLPESAKITTEITDSPMHQHVEESVATSVLPGKVLYETHFRSIESTIEKWLSYKQKK